MGKDARRSVKRARLISRGGSLDVLSRTVFLMAASAILAVPALAAAPEQATIAAANPRLASLNVEIWPEFDRPAALIILKGELSPKTPLPAPVSLRIPGAAGRPSAVAFAKAAGSELLNLSHEASTAGDFTTVRFSAPERFFHIEYYDPLAISGPMRNYTYTWRGDLAVDRLSVRLQEPAAATDISTLPELGRGTPGANGLMYRMADLGAREAGRELVVAVRYNKADSRPSAEILKLNAPAAQSPTPSQVAGASVSRLELALIIAGAVLALVGMVLAVWWLTSQRTKAAFAAQQPAGFCPQCGKALAASDRFCSQCGKPVKKRKRR